MARIILKIQTTEATEIVKAPGGSALFEWVAATTDGFEYDNSSGNVLICLRQTGILTDTTATLVAVPDKFHRTTNITATPSPVVGNPDEITFMQAPLDGFAQTAAQNRIYLDISSTGDPSTLLIAAIR